MATGATLNANLTLNSSQFTAGLRTALASAEHFGEKVERAFSMAGKFLAAGLLVEFGKDLLKAVAEGERFQRSLTRISGGAQAAAVELEKLREIALLPGLDLESAVKGTVKLGEMGMTASESQEALENVANMVASFGGAAPELDAVLSALTKIGLRGHVTAKAFVGLSEALPSIKADMKAAFGVETADQLEKLHLTSEKFIKGLLEEWSKAPRVTSGLTEELKNTHIELERLKESFGEIIASAGPVFPYLISKTREWLDILKEAERLTVSDAMNFLGITNYYRESVDAADTLAKLQAKLKEKQTLGGRGAISQEERDALDKAHEDLLKHRESAYSTQKSGAANDKEKLKIVIQQIDEQERLYQSISDVDLLLQQGADIEEKKLNHQKDSVQLLNEEKALRKSINQDELDRINQSVNDKLKTPAERRRDRADFRHRRTAMESVFNKELRDAIRREQREFKRHEFDRNKRGDFWDREEAKKRLRGQQSKTWADAFTAMKETAKNTKDTAEYLKKIVRA